MKLVEKAVCFECGDRVMARVTLPDDGSRAGAMLTCPACGSTWSPRRPLGTSPFQDDDRDDSFTVNVFLGDGHTLISVSGEIDISTAVRLRDIALAALDDEPRRIVIDLTDVGFMDSTGLAVLVLMRRKTTARGLSLAVVSNPRLNTMLRVSGLDQTFEMHTDVASAVRAVDDAM